MKRPAEVLEPAEVRALLASCSRRAPTGIRNRALLAILYRGGLRVSEALALAPRDVELERATVRVRHGKGDRARTVAVDVEALALLELWRAERASLGAAHSPFLFCSLKGARLKPSYVRALLPRLARRAGIAKRVHAHGLRHAHATELAREGVPMPLIQQQLGHSSLATTDRYVRHLAPQELIERVRARSSWRAPA